MLDYELYYWDLPFRGNFIQLLADWMRVFEHTAEECSLTHSEGYILGSTFSVADIATAALFGTLVHSFPQLGKDLEKTAPRIANLCRRVEARDSIRSFLELQRQVSGNGYCGGQIERSLRDVIR